MKTTCVIIEDQLPAQRLLQKYIRQLDELELVGTFTDGLSALSLLNKHTIDVLFLDINLPKISGLNLLRTLKHPPKVIVTTAYPEYAVEGFELSVHDYLLKPFSFPRFLAAIAKVTQKEAYTANLPSAAYEEKFVFIKANKAIYRVHFEEVRYVKANGDFVHVVTDTESYFLANTLKYWQAILPASHFIRVHKSYIVHLAKITLIQGNIIHIGDAEIPIGRTYRTALATRVDRLMKGDDNG